MESTGVPGSVQISDDTYRLLAPQLAAQFEQRSELEVKGKGVMSTWVLRGGGGGGGGGAGEQGG
jgi:adenylate cyclase